MERILITGKGAADKVREGVNKVAEAASDTLGPFGTLGLIEKGTRITNDGAKIMQEIVLDDEVEDLGARKLKEAVAKSNDQVGDGSTTIAILVQAILSEAPKLLGKEGSLKGKMTTSEFLSKIGTECKDIVSELKLKSKKVESEEEMINSAVVSVENRELGELIGKAQWKLGENGFILAEEVPERETTIEYVHGIKFDNGFGASFVVNNQEKQTLEDSDVRVILTSHTLQSLKPLQALLQQLLDHKQTKVAIVAKGFSDTAIKDCATNIQNGFMVYPINAPYTDQKEVMLDLAAVLGGQFMDYEQHDLEDMQLTDVGFASKIRARRYDAIFTGKNEPDSDKVVSRVTKLKEQLEGSGSDFEKRLLQSRIAQLENGFAVVKVGGESDTERKRVYDKVEDACNAVRAALQEGTVPGGGLAFKEIADKMSEDSILKRPLQSIHTQIMKNAPEGFEIEDWVRDPVKVLRVALEQAVSVAGDLATVRTVITTKKQKYNAYVETPHQ